MTRYTPHHITELASNEVFVFGSNAAGHHGGGAARVAGSGRAPTNAGDTCQQDVREWEPSDPDSKGGGP